MGVREDHASRRKKNGSSGFGYCFTDGRVVSFKVVAMGQSFSLHVAILFQGGYSLVDPLAPHQSQSDG